MRNRGGVSVLDRVEMDVIQMPCVIVIVADDVFPKSALPYSAPRPTSLTPGKMSRARAVLAMIMPDKIIKSNTDRIHLFITNILLLMIYG